LDLRSPGIISKDGGFRAPDGDSARVRERATWGDQYFEKLLPFLYTVQILEIESFPDKEVLKDIIGLSNTKRLSQKSERIIRKQWPSVKNDTLFFRNALWALR